MLEAIQLMFIGYIVYKMVIIKLWGTVSMAIILRVICPQNQGFFYVFQNIKSGLHALEILDTSLILGYTMIAHRV